MAVPVIVQEPWERLEEILQADDPQPLRAYLGALLPGEAARALSRLSQEAHLRVFTLALNTLVAVSVGGTIPLVLRRLKVDPALASGPILTTVTDMCGFFLTLSFAAAFLPRLVP